MNSGEITVVFAIQVVRYLELLSLCNCTASAVFLTEFIYFALVYFGFIAFKLHEISFFVVKVNVHLPEMKQFCVEFKISQPALVQLIFDFHIDLRFFNSPERPETWDQHRITSLICLTQVHDVIFRQKFHD